MSARRGLSGPIYLGYRGEDHDAPCSAFYQPQMAPLSDAVLRPLNLGAQPAELFGALRDAPSMLEEGYGPSETGYAIGRDGEIRVAVLTPMPGVTPEMWDWWFGWHGSDSLRYKLWHPRAHLRAAWADDDRGRRGRQRYVGRTSYVDEYIGSTLTRVAIRFLPPGELGFGGPGLEDPRRETVICARVGPRRQPLDIGYLVHHVRRTPDGAEMRSRFWLGGEHISARTSSPLAATVLSRVAGFVVRPTARAASELLVHCAQEMAHLAGFLQRLHAAFEDS